MNSFDRKVTHSRRRAYARTIMTLIAFLALLYYCLTLTYRFIEKKVYVYTTPEISETDGVTETPSPFPLSVDPRTKTIYDNSLVNSYYTEHISSRGGTNGAKTGWLGRIAAKLALTDWYQNFALLSSKTVVIQSGERKEEVAEHFKKTLSWTPKEKSEFLARFASTSPSFSDGNFFPGFYSIDTARSPDDVANEILNRFDNEILSRYDQSIETIVPLQDALTIASLLEREAYDFTDMREISGVIWNRLFIDMKLQVDATLQYAKGSVPGEKWWPQIVPNDKYLKSPYNTYMYKGLPPGPIANPSLDAILAALNPVPTKCLFYFHDKRGGFHCTKTYEEHVALLKRYYGQGR